MPVDRHTHDQILNEKDFMKENNVANKLILITFIALLGSLLSALYISTVRAADATPNEIHMPDTQPGEHGNLESPNQAGRPAQQNTKIIVVQQQAHTRRQ